MDKSLKIIYSVWIFAVALILFLPMIFGALTDNALAYWTLDDVYTDASGNGKTLTANGAPVFVPGIINNGTDFEKDTPDYLTRAAGDLYPSLPFCVNVWVKPESVGATQIFVIKFASGSHGRYYIRATGANTVDVIVTRASGVAASVTSDSTISIGDWSMITLVADGTDLRLYFNGTEEGTPSALTDLYNVTETPLGIGASWLGASPFDGIMDEIYIRGATCSQDDIDIFWSNGAGSQWPFVADTCTCAGAGNDWEIDMSDNCRIVDDCDLTTGTLSFTGTGWVDCNAAIDTTNMGDPGSSGVLYINSSCAITIN